jgi:hypothetical protein
MAIVRAGKYVIYLVFGPKLARKRVGYSETSLGRVDEPSG